MFGRRLRSRLDLVYPEVGIQAQVYKRQQAQAQNHTKRPRIPDISIGDPVMVRDYSKDTSKWSPAFVQKQTGPISYECTVEDGRMVKRHLDQLLPRTIPEKIADRGTDDGPSDCKIPEAPKTITTPQENTPLILRRSTRTTKPIERLHY